MQEPIILWMFNFLNAWRLRKIKSSHAQSISKLSSDQVCKKDDMHAHSLFNSLQSKQVAPAFTALSIQPGKEENRVSVVATAIIQK